MKFKKSLPLSFLAIFLLGCATLNSTSKNTGIDNDFANELWAETMKITGNNSSLLIPEIKFNEKIRRENILAEVTDVYTLNSINTPYVLTTNGVYQNGVLAPKNKVITFYIKLITENLENLKANEQYRLNRWHSKEIDSVYNLRIYLLYILAHEMLHPAISEKNPNSKNHHRAILERKYWEKLVDFINEKYEIPKNNGLEKIMLQDLKHQISLEEGLESE